MRSSTDDFICKDLVKYSLYPFDSEINFLAQGDGSWENILYKSTQRKTVTLSERSESNGYNPGEIMFG